MFWVFGFAPCTSLRDFLTCTSNISNEVMNVQRCDKGRRFVNLLNPRGSIRSSRVNSWPLALTPPACMNANLPRRLSRQRLVQCRCPPPPNTAYVTIRQCLYSSICVCACLCNCVCDFSVWHTTHKHTHTQSVCRVCTTLSVSVCASVCFPMCPSVSVSPMSVWASVCFSFFSLSLHSSFWVRSNRIAVTVTMTQTNKPICRETKWEGRCCHSDGKSSAAASPEL